MPPTAGCADIVSRIVHRRTLPFTSSVAGLVVLSAVAPPTGAQGAPTVPPSCRYGSWSAPHPVVRSPSRPTTLRFASVAAGSTRAYVVGNDIPFFTPDTVRRDPLLVAELGHGLLGRPPGHFTFAIPRAIVDDRQRLHLLWGEPDTARVLPATTWPDQRLTSLWQATYDPGGGWSVPSKVYQSTWLKWFDGALTAGRRTADGAMHLAVPDARILYLRFNDGAWHVRRGPKVNGVAYASVAADASGRVFVAYIAPDHSHPPDANSVFLVASSDRGESWQEPKLVSRSGANRAWEVQALLGVAGDLHLLWKQDRPDSSAAIRHVISRDGGTTWSSPDDLQLPADYLGMLRSAIDACGAVHVVFQELSDRGVSAHIMYARWTGRWSAPARVFPGLFSVEPTLSVDESHIIFVFLGRRAELDTLVPLETLYAELAVARPGPPAH